MVSQVILDVDGLTGGWSDRELFYQLSFSVSAGEIVQIEGANGTGKTTLLRILAQLSRRYQGSLRFFGEDIKRHRAYYLRNMLFVGHAQGNQPILTPMENLRWYFSSRESLSDGQLMEALDKVGLYGYEQSPCHSLSAGQQRRVSLARLYLSHAPLWILDEPFTAIDKKGVAELELFIGNHAERGGSVVLTTHHRLSIESNIKKLTLGL